MRTVKEILEEHKGVKQAIHSRKIAEMIGIKEGDTFSQTRGIIERVLSESDLPIGALSAGYFVITNEEELDGCLADLEKRAQKISSRKRKIFRNYVAKYGPPSSGTTEEDVE